MSVQNDIIEPPVASSDFRPYMIIGLVSIFLTFGLVGFWSATAPLNQGAIAPGTVSVASNIKQIQHFEGGIVRDILVREGDIVTAGQTLVRLDPTESQANSDAVSNQFYAALAREARLIAERDDAPSISFPQELLDGAKINDSLAKILEDEERSYKEKRLSIKGQIGLLEERYAQLTTQVEGLTAEKSGLEEQVRLIREELVGLRELNAKGFYPKSNILAKEREEASLAGMIGRLTANISQAEQAKGETLLQMEQFLQEQREKVVSDLMGARIDLKSLTERRVVANDRLRRIEVVAPTAGTVQNIKIHTVGGVVRPGEVMMDIVPDNDALIIAAKASPMDIDSISKGQQVEVRFSTLSLRLTPVVMGTVETVSADSLLDEMSGYPYYAVRIVVDETELNDYIRSNLTPGLPVEAIVTTGERTLLEYLIKPLADAFARSMIEE